jgi:hypothetical protein
MRSLRSVVGALRKDHTCESVLVGKIVVGGTRASSVGDGVGAIEIGLALGLIDATEERDVLSRSGKVVDSSVIDPESVTRLGRCWSRGNSTDTSNNTGVCGGTNDTKRAIEMLAVMRAFAASRTHRVGTGSRDRATRVHVGGKTKNRSV